MLLKMITNFTKTVDGVEYFYQPWTENWIRTKKLFLRSLRKHNLTYHMWVIRWKTGKDNKQELSEKEIEDIVNEEYGSLEDFPKTRGFIVNSLKKNPLFEFKGKAVKEDFLSLFKKSRENKVKFDYDFSLLPDILGSFKKTKISVICREINPATNKEYGKFETTPEKILKSDYFLLKGKKISQKRSRLNKKEDKLVSCSKEKSAKLIEEANEVHGNRYSYSNIGYMAKKLVGVIVCPNHGPFIQDMYRHINLSQGCPACGIIQMTTTQSYKLDEFISDATALHGDEYDYSLLSSIDSFSKDIKVPIICKTHGEFLQSPRVHLLGCGCPQCGLDKLKSNTEDFIKKAINIHGELYDYSKAEYTGYEDPITIICKKHGEFVTTPQAHLVSFYKGNCPKCSMTSGEAVIDNYLQNYNLDYIYQYQTEIPRENINKKVVIDFVVFLSKDRTLWIEYNGKQHYERVEFFQKTYSDFIEQQERDKSVRQFCSEEGIDLLEIPYNLNRDEIIDLLDRTLYEKK